MTLTWREERLPGGGTTTVPNCLVCVKTLGEAGFTVLLMQTRDELERAGKYVDPTNTIHRAIESFHQAGHRFEGEIRDGFAVRRDWPDGTHEFVRYRVDRQETSVQMLTDSQYWMPGPWRPYRYTVVAMSEHDFDLHTKRIGCRAPDCPSQSAK